MAAPGLSWLRVLDEWDAMKWAIREEYGVDLDLDHTPYTWHWLESTVTALLTQPVTRWWPGKNRPVPVPPNRLWGVIHQE